MSYTKSKDGSEIYYEMNGEGKITLCWISGGGGLIEHWKLQKNISSEYKMLYIDFAGHGKSKSNREKYTMHSFGEDVAAVLECENLQNVILIGWSMGGPITLEAAKLVADRVIGLIGVDTFFPYPGLYTANTKENVDKIMEQFKEDTDNKIIDLYRYHMNNGIKVSDELQQEFITLNYPDKEVFLSEVEELAYWDVLPFLKNTVYPIKAVMAGLSVPEEQRRYFAEYNIDAVFMEGHGHALHWSGPEEFNKLLLEKIKDIENNANQSQKIASV